jgi:hypothetical protein
MFPVEIATVFSKRREVTPSSLIETAVVVGLRNCEIDFAAACFCVDLSN